MPSLGFPELILILVIALIIFGPGKLPSVGASIGKALNEFKKASRELTKDDVDEKISQEEKAVK
ncbi:twin-arginine translocase TatA/TatE family subunit [Clostridium chromiireducens]|jgi:sec-independent protein translocase protein TatA|uniref:Sec-independent protein translocase protein TatA n=1 Tax=Clostridium chromiireducens TaxID=225345 RepID=A0A1V4ILE6_9CLOT|nr:twin-arginine translocase TatA/TatE family subunit [Clostridium chromiireducens]OPJ60689.1 Sec-independent protein translocase protein TatAd [Clostridium chromiireducens]RII36542.1 twin-arginine translocase TatA/TatE family subunit [Clostridium chromiireducens]